MSTGCDIASFALFCLTYVTSGASEPPAPTPPMPTPTYHAMRTRANTCASEAFGIVVVDDDNDNDADNDADHHQHRVAAHIKCVSRLIRVRVLDGPVRMRHFSRPDLAVRRTCRRRRARWPLFGPVTTPLLRTPFPLIMRPQHARTHARPQSWAKRQKINIGQGTLSLFSLVLRARLCHTARPFCHLKVTALPRATARREKFISFIHVVHALETKFRHCRPWTGSH